MNKNIENYVIIASLNSETMDKLINLISSLQGSLWERIHWIPRQASRCQQAFSKPCLVPHLVVIILSEDTLRKNITHVKRKKLTHHLIGLNMKTSILKHKTYFLNLRAGMRNRWQVFYSDLSVSHGWTSFISKSWTFEIQILTCEEYVYNILT